MTFHPGIRKTVKWGGLALSLLLAGVWVRSEWIVEVCQWGKWDVTFVPGGTQFVHRPESTNERISWFRLGPSRGAPRWWWVEHGTTPEKEAWAVVPIGMVFTPTLLVTATAWRLDSVARRRACTGLCPKCR